MFRRNSIALFPRSLGLTVALGGVLVVSPAFAAEKPLHFKPPRVYCAQQDGQPGGAHCVYSGPLGLAVGDIIGDGVDPDGNIDVVVANSETKTISVFRNSGDWSATDPGLVLDQVYPILDPLAKPYDVELVNLQREPGQPMEPFLDIVVTIRTLGEEVGQEEYLLILWNDGTGHYDSYPQTRITLSVLNVNGLTTADVDANGTPDFIVGGHWTDPAHEITGSHPQVDVVMGATSGGYSVQHYDFEYIGGLPIEGQATDAVAAPVRLPQVGGRLDLLVSLELTSEFQNEDHLLVFLNDGPDSNGLPIWTPSFQPGRNSNSVVFGKLGTRPYNDAVLACQTSVMLDSDNVVFRDQGNGTGAFNLRTPGDALTEYEEPFQMDIGRLNPDTLNDVVVTCQKGIPSGGCGSDQQGGIAVLLSKSDGTFWPTIHYFATEPVCEDPPWKGGPTFVRIADFDDDGQNDVVVSNTSSGSISVLLNSSLQTLPP
ncbi:MAG: hypothetical protein HZB38_03725 [Planctomycetes bacterium]|nr:hypothetical protein [Planctomycetota bacterium]